MIKNIIWFLKDYRWVNMRWLGIYLIALPIPFLGFLGNKRFACAVTIISFGLFFVFWTINAVEIIKHNINNKFKHEKKRNFWGTSAVFTGIYLIIADLTLPTIKFIYYEFLLGDVPFSMEVLKSIFMLHSVIILFAHLSYINQHKL